MTTLMDLETAGQESQTVTELNRVIESRHGEDVAPTRAGATRARARDGDAILFTASDGIDSRHAEVVAVEEEVTTTRRRVILRTSILPSVDTSAVLIVPAEPAVRAVRRQRIAVIGGVALMPLLLWAAGIFVAQGEGLAALIALTIAAALAATAVIEGRRPAATN